MRRAGFQCVDNRCTPRPPRPQQPITCPADMARVADTFCVDTFEASRPDATSASSGKENPELATQFNIQGIPAVKAFRHGQVVDEFVGAKPAPAIRQWLAALAPSGDVQAAEKAELLLAAGKPAQAEPLLRGLLTSQEVRDRALVGLARALLDRGQDAEAEGLLATVNPQSPVAEQIPPLRRRLQFTADASAFGGEAAARAALERQAGDLEARWALASALAARGDFPQALEEFLDLVTRSRKFRDDGARLAMLAIFELLGGNDLVREYRRRLQVVI